LTVWRATTRQWFWRSSSSNYANGRIVAWGNASLGDHPLLGDFDGDGASDIVIYRGTTGQWYWLSSGSGFASAFSSVPLGGSSYVPMLK